MKLWIDDERPPPDLSWLWRENSGSTIRFLNSMYVAMSPKEFEEISLDHDLGGDDTTRPVMMWMIENDYWPKCISIHTANPVGAEWLRGMAEQYGPEDMEIV